MTSNNPVVRKALNAVARNAAPSVKPGDKVQIVKVPWEISTLDGKFGTVLGTRDGFYGGKVVVVKIDGHEYELNPARVVKASSAQPDATDMNGKKIKNGQKVKVDDYYRVCGGEIGVVVGMSGPGKIMVKFDGSGNPYCKGQYEIDANRVTTTFAQPKRSSEQDIKETMDMIMEDSVMMSKARQFGSGKAGIRAYAIKILQDK